MNIVSQGDKSYCLSKLDAGYQSFIDTYIVHIGDKYAQPDQALLIFQSHKTNLPINSVSDGHALSWNVAVNMQELSGLYVREDGSYELIFLTKKHKLVHKISFVYHCKMATGPVYISENKDGNIFLLFTPLDFKYVMKNSHAGAFGQDFKSVLDEEGTDWVLLWKIPDDLNHIPTFEPIVNIPVAVGTYPLIEDAFARSGLISPIFAKTVARKMRNNTSKGVAFHWLEPIGKQASSVGKLAALSSTYFIDSFSEVSKQEEDCVKSLVMRLHNTLGITSFMCFGQHHSLVFLMTPQELRIVLDDTVKGKVLLNVLTSHSSLTGPLETWSKVYNKLV